MICTVPGDQNTARGGLKWTQAYSVILHTGAKEQTRRCHTMYLRFQETEVGPLSAVGRAAIGGGRTCVASRAVIGQPRGQLVSGGRQWTCVTPPPPTQRHPSMVSSKRGEGRSYERQSYHCCLRKTE